MNYMRALILLPLLAATSTVSAHGFTHGDITITHPFLRSTPPAATNGAGYMVVTNMGSDPDTLLAIETPAAEEVQFHRTVITDGIASMQPVEGGFEIPAGGEVVVGDKGTHLMLVNVTQPIREGEIIEATLTFEKAGELEMYFEVEPLGKVIDQHAGGGHGE